MSEPSRWINDYYVNGQVSCTTLTLPASCIGRDAFSATAALLVKASKFERQHMLTHSQESGVDVADETEIIHHVRGVTGEIVDLEIFIETAPTGGDKAFDVDLEKKSIGGSWASVLSAAVTIDSADSDLSISVATVSSAALVDGDQLRVVVTTSGSTGSQGQGLAVTVSVRDDGE